MLQSSLLIPRPFRSAPQLPCPANTVSADGAGSALDCVPKPGYYGDNGNAASPCPSGFYCAGGSGVPAARCPVGTTSPQYSTTVAQCSVLAAYYGRYEPGSSCRTKGLQC